MDKINRLQIWIIAGVLSAITAAVVWFALISPARDAFDVQDKKYQAADAIAIQRPAAERDLKKAKQEVAAAQADWRKYDRTYMPDIDLSNLYRAMRQLWREQLTVLGPSVNKYLQADKKVQVQANIALPAPPTDPNAVNQQVFVYDLGNVSVQGTFNDVLNHVARWNKFNRLVLADGLTLAGNSPQLVGTYSLRVFEFPHNADKVGPSFPSAGGATGGFGGGGFGGPPSGYGGYGGSGGPTSSSGPPPGYGGYGGRGPSSSSGPPPGYSGGSSGAPTGGGATQGD